MNIFVVFVRSASFIFIIFYSLGCSFYVFEPLDRSHRLVVDDRLNFIEDLSACYTLLHVMN